MTKITLNLRDDEFMELGGLAFGYLAANASGRADKSSFGRLIKKVKAQIDAKSTPGQVLHLEKVVAAIRKAAVDHEVDVMMMKDGFSGMMEGIVETLTNE